MKSIYKNEPPRTVKWSEAEVLINFNAVKRENEDGEEYWECESLVVKSEIMEGSDYGELVDALVRREYSLSQELAIHRQKDTKPDDWETYNTYVEECKLIAKEIWQTR